MTRKSLVGQWAYMKISVTTKSRLCQIIDDHGTSVVVQTDDRTAELMRDEVSLLQHQPGYDLVPRRKILPYGVWTCADGGK